jgi:hypothetical protein
MIDRRRLCSPLLLLLISAGVISAQQNPCKVKLADLAPAAELRGFSLGMTPDQVKAKVPQVAFGRTDELGVSKTSINPDFDPRIDKTNFGDVRTISLDFLDGRVVSVWIGFEGTFKWKNIEEFVQGVSQELALPAEWTTKGRAQQLNCTDFQLSVSMIAQGPSLRILDLPADKTIAERRQAKADEAEAAEAPVTGDSKNKVYYANNCAALKAVPEKTRVAFDNAEEAEKAGYKKAPGCP